MAYDLGLAAWWQQTTKSVEDQAATWLTSWTKDTIDKGLASVSAAIGGDGTSSTQSTATTLWDKLKAAFKSGAAQSDLGKAAELSSAMKNPAVIAAAALLGIVFLWKVFK